MTRLYAGERHGRMRMLQHVTWHGTHRYMDRSTRGDRAVQTVGRRGVQLREVDVGRLQLQGRRLVRRRRQPATLAPPRDQHRVAVLMRMMAMMMVVRTTADRTRASRTLLQAGRAVMTTSLDPVNRTRRSRRTRRGAPRTWWTRQLKTSGSILTRTRGHDYCGGILIRWWLLDKSNQKRDKKADRAVRVREQLSVLLVAYLIDYLIN